MTRDDGSRLYTGQICQKDYGTDTSVCSGLRGMEGGRKVRGGSYWEGSTFNGDLVDIFTAQSFIQPGLAARRLIAWHGRKESDAVVGWILTILGK